MASIKGGWKHFNQNNNLNTDLVHLLVFFSLLVESFVIFFRQFICRVVTIILLVSNFPDLLVRSFRSASFTLKNLQDKPCCDNSANGTVKYAQKKFLWRHFIKFVENQIYLILPRHVVSFTWYSAKSSVNMSEDRGKNRHGNRNVKHDLRPPISGIKIN